MRFLTLGIVIAILVGAAPAEARDWLVAPGGAGDGSSGAPFGTIQAGLDAAAPGDVVIVAAGAYTGPLQTTRDATQALPIIVRGTGAVIVTATGGRVLTVSHPHHIIEGLTLDGAYGDQDAVRIEDAASFTTLRNCEIRRATRDCVDMGAPANVTIEGCLIHHCLNAAGGRTDAHGIVGGAVRDLVIRTTEIHTFSGDAVQFDPGRAAPGWDRITIEACRFWLAPLPAAENGFPAGTVTGENAVDTKVLAGTTAHLTIRDTVAYGFRGGLLTNMAAYNLKETVDATLDRLTIYDSEIALRLRAPATVAVSNAVIYDVDTAVRYEDNIVGPKLYSSTFGRAVTTAFQAASSSATVIDGKNVLVLGASLPAQLVAGSGSLAVDATAFVDAANDDYHLAPSSPAIDQGLALTVAVDRDGVVRPQGAGHDVGAYERCDGTCPVAPDAGVGGGDGGTGGGGGDEPGGCCSANRVTDGLPGLLVLGLFATGRRRRVMVAACGSQAR